jgi:hypothetical protein
MVRYYFLHLTQSHEKIVELATSKLVFPSEIIVVTEVSAY